MEVWFLDEARVGQTGRVCRRWDQRGLRPRGGRELRHQAGDLFGAVCPARDAGVALVLPMVSAGAMPVMLDELGQAVAPNAHAVGLLVYYAYVWIMRARTPGDRPIVIIELARCSAVDRL